MRLRLFVAALAVAVCSSLAFGESPVKVVGLRVEHEAAGMPAMGIGVVKPRLSWKLESARAGEEQKGYEIRAAADVRDLERQPGGAATRWSTGKVESGQSVLVPWAGWELARAGRCIGRCGCGTRMGK